MIPTVEEVWGHDRFFDERIVTVHIRNLLRKLSDDATYPRFIRTVRGVEYTFIGCPAGEAHA